jgi:hypothetical protein
VRVAHRRDTDEVTIEAEDLDEADERGGKVPEPIRSRRLDSVVSDHQGIARVRLQVAVRVMGC